MFYIPYYEIFDEILILRKKQFVLIGYIIYGILTPISSFHMNFWITSPINFL